eukprot:8470686-Pyramimonas_sp.AAC.1
MQHSQQALMAQLIEFKTAMRTIQKQLTDVSVNRNKYQRRTSAINSGIASAGIIDISYTYAKKGYGQ